MGTTYKDGEEYLVMYPSFRRWINRCIACGAQGYKPEMPENNEPGFKGQTLRRYYQPLSVNDIGLCEVCSRAVRKS